MRTTYTRGHGLLEKQLSRLRARKADILIPDSCRNGWILDIGCGAYPFFLKSTQFNKKIGIDQQNCQHNVSGIKMLTWDISSKAGLPIKNDSFDTITMLAVLEHIEQQRLIEILNEIQRVLKPGGYFIATSPVSWTKSILFILSRINLLSKTEVDDHKFTYTLGSIKDVINNSNFNNGKKTLGYFEFGMNMWICICKPPLPEG